MRRFLTVLLAAAAIPALAACDHAHSPTAATATVLASVVPAGGAIGVDPNTPVTIQFNHPMMAGMEQYAMLHEGGVTGQEVPGTWTLSSDSTTLTFSPASPLKSQTEYTIHVGAGMMDDDDQPVDMDPGEMMGGQWATGSMFGSGGMMGGNYSGMMGQGWQGANGTYGMIFSFTTA